MRILRALALATACSACSPSGSTPERNAANAASSISLPNPLVPPVTMDDSRWLEGLWLGCHAVVREYDEAWADNRLDADDLAIVAAAVAREHARDPEGRTCRYARAVPPVLARSRTQRLLGRIGLTE